VIPMTEPRALIWVPGRPRPKGSLRAVGRVGERARLVEQVDPKGTWRAKVKAAALELMNPDHTPWDVPLDAYLVFFLPKPKRPKFQVPATAINNGDWDKLARVIGDALQVRGGAGLIRDDALIVNGSVTKVYAPTPDHIGAQLLVQASAERPNLLAHLIGQSHIVTTAKENAA
jgi:Holliday junction resolvase RusA-like endonuclease